MSSENSLAVSTLAQANTAAPSSDGAQPQSQEMQKTVATVQQPANDAPFSAKPTMGEIIEFQATGLLVVFVVLGSITIFCKLIASVLKVIAPDQFYCRKSTGNAPVAPVASIPAKAEQLATPAAAKTIHPGLADDKLLAILATAVQEVLGQPASIVKFRTMGSMDWTWSVQGRVSHHSSHKL